MDFSSYRPASQSVSEYGRESALHKKSRRKRRIKVGSPSQENAARIFGLLGQSGILANLAKIADAAESGALPITDELAEELWDVLRGEHRRIKTQNENEAYDELRYNQRVCDDMVFRHLRGL